MKSLSIYRMTLSCVLIFCVAPIILISQGCAAHSETISRAPEAFLAFTGNRAGEVWVNGQKVADLETEKENVRLRVNPGLTKIEVRRGGTPIVNKTFLTSDGQVVEIVVP